MKLLVLDGNSIVNRAFYGIKLLTTKDGRFTNAIYGFMNILNSLIEREKPDGIAVAFDLHAPTFRHKIYDEYKAGRKPMPQELREQIPVLKELLPLFGYKCIEEEGYEADDILGTLSLAAEKSGNTCVISTGDRDSLQLVSDKTKVLLAATKAGRPEITDYDKAMLFEKYGLAPDEMIELKALMGDASDHIPGVAGVGQKTAGELISKYHNIKYIYDNINTLEIKDSVRNKLIVGKESAMLSHTLGTIFRSVPISTEMNDYVIGKRDDRNLAIMLKKLEFYKMLDKLGLNEMADIARDEPAEKARKFELCGFEQIFDVISENKNAVVLPDKNKFGISSGDKICVTEDENNIIKILNSEIKLSVGDGKALYNRFFDSKITAETDFDILLAGYLCSPSSGSYNIERLSDEYLNTKPEIDSDDETAEKTARAVLLTEKLKERVNEAGLYDLLMNIEIPLSRVLSKMEVYGVLIDCDSIKNMSKNLKERIENLEQDIYKLAGKSFNIKSPSQLGTVLFEDLDLPSKKKTKTGYSTNADILEKLKNYHPIINLILEYRTLTKLDSTYCEGLLKAVAADGRIHTTFNQTETRTGRISSLEPNLQNIPVRTDVGRELRKFFSADNGYVLIDADYSQIELRVLADISNDKNMLDAFKNNVDIHTKTASEVFSMPPVLVTPQMRRSAKAVNFGIVYGMGAFTLASDIGVSRAEASSYIEGYFRTYPNVKKYMDSVVEQAKIDGFVTTSFGRRRYIPELKNSNKNLVAFGERVAKNMPIQGTAADIIKLAMINVDKRLTEEKLNARIILQVHDELIIEVAEGDAEKAGEILKTEMQNAVTLKVPLTVDMHTGKTWYDAKG